MSDLEIRPLRAEETRLAAELGAYAFPHRPPSDRERDFGRRVDPGREVLVALEDGEIVAQVHLHAMGVWIDGVRFASGGLTNVVTAPERSRRGIATRLLRAALRWMCEELGYALATLYPTVYPLYRRLGWVQAEEPCRYVGAPAAFRPSAHLPSDPAGRLVRRPARLDDVALLEPVYRAFARGRRGYLDRPGWYWEDYVLRRRHGADGRWLALWCGADRCLGGYALYAFDRPPAPGLAEPTLSVYDLIALRPEAYRAILGFLASHHLWGRMVVDGGRDVPWWLLVDNPQELRTEGAPGGGFMLRVLDLQRTITQKAPPAQPPARDVVLRVVDPEAPWNHGDWLVGARGEAWICERVADRPIDAAVDIATFAALFVGVLAVRQARDLGLLVAAEGVGPPLEALFAGTYPPHSNDHF
jgi:predicted acetyltransferase